MPERLKLSPLARGTMLALIEVIQPKGGMFTLDLKEHMLDFTEQMLVSLPKDLRLLFPWGLTLFEFGPPVFMLTFRRFSKMSFEDRDAYVRNWSESDIMLRREMMKGIRSLALLGYFEHPAIKEQLGFMSDEYIENIGEERLEKYGTEITAIQSRTS